MRKKIVWAIVILIALCVGIGIFYLANQKSERTETDAIRFKKEYESLNDTVRDTDGAHYNNVKISEDNPIQYISALEAIDIIKNKTGIIYFGENWCPWCRNAVEVLFAAADQNDLETIYYVEPDTVKNLWEVHNGKLIKTQEEKEGYYALLEALDEVLSEDNYILKDEDGNLYDTGEKRIYMPFIIAVKNGNIIGSHSGTVSLNEGQTKYDKLTSEQYDELYEIYDQLIRSVKPKDSCTTNEIETECS